MGNDKIEDIGIYINIHESGNFTKDGHKLYFATCKMCGTMVEKLLADIKRNHTLCYHKTGYRKGYATKFNDMPSGWITESKLNQRIYDLWKAMLYRTTEVFWDKYPTYKGTTVDESWRTLSNFVNDIKELPGYKEWSESSHYKMMIDKDTLVEGNKHYSKETCCFITHTESNIDVHNRHPENIEKANKAFIEKHSIPVRLQNKKSGMVLEFSSIKEACRVLNLNFRHVWMILSDKYPGHYSTKGWYVEKIDKNDAQDT